MKTIPETAKLSKKSKKEVLVPVVGESQSEEEGGDDKAEEGEEERVKELVVGEKMETPEIKSAPEPAAGELAVVKSFKELV